MPALTRPRFALRSAFAALALLASFAQAQPLADRGFARGRAFDMPFTLTPADRANVRELKLYIKPEQGGEWQLHATASPAQTQYDARSQMQVGKFEVRAPSDGAFLFAIMTVFNDGTSMPMSVDQLRPEQTVSVDSKPPIIMLRSLPTRPRGDGRIIVGVEWKAEDEALAKGGVRLEGRYYGAPAWTNLVSGAAEESGRQEWTILSNQRMEVRVSAADRAGNQATKTILLGANVGTVTGGSAGPGTPPGSSPSQPNFRLVKDRSITLQYKVRERPPSGLDKIDLYVTRLGNDWKKHEPPYRPPGPETDTADIAFDAPDDGTYGFAMIATSKAGQAPPAPKSNDPPQLWVEVDTKKPDATLKTVKLVNPNDARTIVLEWKAEDKNIELLPIIFEYAEVDAASGQPGKWQELTMPLPNNGRYLCAAPQLGPTAYQFMVRMNVFDKAGNITTINHPTPISLDVVKPQVEITDVKPAGSSVKPSGGPQP